jgi:hypothetical protein
MGITIHFINKNWQIESSLLDMIDLKEKHSGLYLFQILEQVLNDFNIKNHIFR